MDQVGSQLPLAPLVQNPARRRSMLDIISILYYIIYHIKHDPPCRDDPKHSFHSHRFDIIRTLATGPGHTPAKLIGRRRNYGLEYLGDFENLSFIS